ncbi:succinylglutamate desuccinylase/aspartoacylase family protein [Candidatus Neomarinimicrobiota bacterium]
MREPITIGGIEVAAGERRNIDLSVAKLYTHTQLHMPVEVLHGRRKGPRLFVCATLHGDEVNGLEIIRQLLDRLDVGNIRGTLIAVPIVNVFGFIYQSRYLPDRRDLNRSFPGSSKGSLAGRLANLFMNEVVLQCTYGIDLHTGAPPRTNLPQIRADLNSSVSRECAEAFRAPIMIHKAGPEGSMRRVATHRGIPVMLYEAGETLRFDQDSIRIGVEGILRVMKHLKMLDGIRTRRGTPSQEVSRTSWIRARQSGILRLTATLGSSIRRHEALGVIADPFGETSKLIKAPFGGMIIGMTTNPLVHRGDALIHLAAIKDTAADAKS